MNDNTLSGALNFRDNIVTSFALPPARASSGAELGRRVALIFFELPIDKFSGEVGFAVRPLARASNKDSRRPDNARISERIIRRD